MTKKNRLWVGLAVVVLIPSVAFLSGCTKKVPLKNETTVIQEQKPIAQAPGKASTGDKGSKESAVGGQGLREETLMAGGKAPESAERESKEQEMAILKELRIPDIHFDFNAFTLKPENQAILREAAKAYLKYPKYKLVIEGHCDERGTMEYNLALGQKRAEEAAMFLIDLGVAKERIRTISYGKEKPLDPRHDEEALARNRRDHFVVFP